MRYNSDKKIENTNHNIISWSTSNNKGLKELANKKLFNATPPIIYHMLLKEKSVVEFFCAPTTDFPPKKRRQPFCKTICHMVNGLRNVFTLYPASSFWDIVTNAYSLYICYSAKNGFKVVYYAYLG